MITKDVEKEPISVLAEAPNTPDDEALFEAAMKAAQDELTPAAEQTPIVPEVKAEATPVVTTGVEPARVATSTAPVEQKIAPALLKLMEREATLVEREGKVKQYEADLENIKNQVTRLEAAEKKFRYDPISYIRQLAPDIDLADLAKQLWYEKLGNTAPAEYTATREARAAKGSIEELRAEFKAEQQRLLEDIQRQQAEVAYNQYLGSLSAFSRDIPPEYPLVKAFAIKSPERVQAGLLKVAQKHAQATGGAVLTPAEAAKAFNDELAALQAVFVPSAPAAPSTPVKQEQPTSLRNKYQSVQPNRTAPDPNDEEILFQRALEEARAHFK